MCACRRKCWLTVFYKSVSAPLPPFPPLPFPSLLALSARASRAGRITGHGRGARLGLPGRRGPGGGSGSLPPLRPAPANFPSFLWRLPPATLPRPRRGETEPCPRGAAQVRLQRGPPLGAFPWTEGSLLRRAQILCLEFSILRDTEIVYCCRRLPLFFFFF